MATIKGLWLFKENISLSSSATQTVRWGNQKSGMRYTGFLYESGYIYCLIDGSKQGTFYNNSTKKFTSFSSRIIYFGETDQTVSDSFITWITANADAIIIDDLTDTRWKILTGWTAPSGYNYIRMNINGAIEGMQNDTPYPTEPTEFQSFNIGYNSSDKATADYVNFNNGSISYNAQNSSFTMYISGGTDVSKEYLIAWLTAYGSIDDTSKEDMDALSIQYDGNPLTSLQYGKTATLHCAGKNMTSDLVITASEMSEAKLHEKTITEMEIYYLVLD